MFKENNSKETYLELHFTLINEWFDYTQYYNNFNLNKKVFIFM